MTSATYKLSSLAAASVRHCDKQLLSQHVKQAAGSHGPISAPRPHADLPWSDAEIAAQELEEAAGPSSETDSSRGGAGGRSSVACSLEERRLVAEAADATRGHAEGKGNQFQVGSGPSRRPAGGEEGGVDSREAAGGVEEPGEGFDRNRVNVRQQARLPEVSAEQREHAPSSRVQDLRLPVLEDRTRRLDPHAPAGSGEEMLATEEGVEEGVGDSRAAAVKLFAPAREEHITLRGAVTTAACHVIRTWSAWMEPRRRKRSARKSAVSPSWC
eukprot:756537-Hanusia_phi.AAC.5